MIVERQPFTWLPSAPILSICSYYWSAKLIPNLQDIWGQSPLHVAIGSFADSIFKVCITHLLYSFQLKHPMLFVLIVQILLEHPSTNLDLKSKGGITPLTLAVKMLNNHMVHALITKGVEISTTDSEGRVIYYRPLINNDLSSVFLLPGRTAVHWAAMMGNLEALKELVSHGPDTIKDVQNVKVRNIESS